MSGNRKLKLKFKSALVEREPDQPIWQTDVCISIDDGLITGIECDVSNDDDVISIDGVAIPAMVNAHSHAFQRGFAGLSEFQTSTRDSFWTWRELMYGFVQRLTPEDVFVIARQLYLEMLIAGYSWVGEFHYLHHADRGSGESDLTMMADALLRAASETGLGICLLPVLYQRSGFDFPAPDKSQRRFALTDEQYVRMLERCKSSTANAPNARLGMAIHSLRAVSPHASRTALEFRKTDMQWCPVHIHVAEQTKEVDECRAATGKRSVEYLFSQFDVDEHWCLIHATHVNSAEIEMIVRSGATVGLCPTTEANLGDGFFPASDFLDSGGQIAIGSDSHCNVDFREELRTLEYGQRLLLRQRAVLGSAAESVGRRLFLTCARGGAQAIGVATGRLAVGYRADLIVVDDQHAVIAGAKEDRLLDRLVFTNAGNPISRRMIGGHWIDEAKLISDYADSSRDFAKLNERLLR